MSKRTIILPPGTLKKIRAMADGFRTKRQISDALEKKIGLTYQLLFEMTEGIYPYEERGNIRKCRYEDTK